MTLIKSYNLSESHLLHSVVDTSGGQYLWLLFADTLKKVSANDPTLIYFDIAQTQTLVKGYVSGSYIYLAVDDATYIGKRYSLTAPITSYTNFSLPAGIVEAPVDLLVSGSYVYFLIPGNDLGTNAKIVKMSTAGVFSETIDLTTVTNAKSFVMVGTEFWVVTYGSPSTYVRVYDDSGWTYTINS